MKYDSFAALWAPLTMLALLGMGVHGGESWAWGYMGVSRTAMNIDAYFTL